jgi:hypothetical protein
VQDWDEEDYEDEVVEEEEEFIRVQQEIKRLCQEQESIMRRQAAAQWAKLEGSISIKSEQGLEGYSTTSTSFGSRNKGKSLRSINCSIIPTPTLHHHKNTTFPMPTPPHRHHDITFPTTIQHHLCHKINSSSHHHPRILTPWTPNVH